MAKSTNKRGNNSSLWVFIGLVIFAVWLFNPNLLSNPQSVLSGLSSIPVANAPAQQQQAVANATTNPDPPVLTMGHDDAFPVWKGSYASNVPVTKEQLVFWEWTVYIDPDSYLLEKMKDRDIGKVDSEGKPIIEDHSEYRKTVASAVWDTLGRYLLESDGFAKVSHLDKTGVESIARGKFIEYNSQLQYTAYDEPCIRFPPVSDFTDAILFGNSQIAQSSGGSTDTTTPWQSQQGTGSTTNTTTNSGGASTTTSSTSSTASATSGNPPPPDSIELELKPLVLVPVTATVEIPTATPTVRATTVIFVAPVATSAPVAHPTPTPVPVMASTNMGGGNTNTINVQPLIVPTATPSLTPAPATPTRLPTVAPTPVGWVAPTMIIPTMAPIPTVPSLICRINAAGQEVCESY